MRVIILDDDDSRREQLRRGIIEEFSSVEIAQACCVDDAKAMMRASYFDVLITDVVIPRRSDRKDPSRLNAFDLLSQLARSPSLKKPEKIIGITAHLDDIDTFRREFEVFCSVVIEAKVGSGWIKRVNNYLRYTSSSKASRISAECGVHVFTVHGIRTYGAWQDVLRSLVVSRRDDVSFKTYKYGYFSALSFVSPWHRNRQVQWLSDRIRAVSLSPGARVVVFSHSFGTYLTILALKGILDDVAASGIDLTVVLSGSVLGSDFDLSDFRRVPNVRVVNECGDRDVVLYLSSLVGGRLGMAGKTGFNGFVDERFVNRFYAGGHSHYFSGDFMENYWLPLIFEDSACVPLDLRGRSSKLWTFTDQVFNGLSVLRFPLVLAFVAFVSACVLAR